MESRVQSTVGCFSELCFLQFSVAQVLVGLQNQFINNYVYKFLRKSESRGDKIDRVNSIRNI